MRGQTNNHRLGKNAPGYPDLLAMEASGIRQNKVKNFSLRSELHILAAAMPSLTWINVLGKKNRNNLEFFHLTLFPPARKDNRINPQFMRAKSDG